MATIIGGGGHGSARSGARLYSPSFPGSHTQPTTLLPSASARPGPADAPYSFQDQRPGKDYRQTHTSQRTLVERPEGGVSPPLQPSLLSAAIVVSNIYETLKPRLSASLAPTTRPIIIRGVEPVTWALFRESYAEHPGLQQLKAEYDGSRLKLIVYPIAQPLHDIALKVMNKQITRMDRARFASITQIDSLMVDRENFSKRNSNGTPNQREPDGALWTPTYESGIIPTIVWEVGNSQKRSSLLRRAKMWCRRYDGKVQAVILVKYICKNPAIDNSSFLEVYRPAWLPRRPGMQPRWTARRDGRVYQLFPRPAEAVEGNDNNPADAVPLTYQDYFGSGNVEGGVDPSTRFDLPLELVRRIIQVVVPVTRLRAEYRFPSGGSTVSGGSLDVEMDGHSEEQLDDTVLEQGGRENTPFLDEEDAEEDWDAVNSEISDSDHD